MAVEITTADIRDFRQMLAMDYPLFKDEARPKARVHRRYFAAREKLAQTLVMVRARLPAGTKATDVPTGVDAKQFKKLVDKLADAGKLLRTELKEIPDDAPLPQPWPRARAFKTLSDRHRAREKLKDQLIAIYGKDKGKFRYRWYEKVAKTRGKEGSPGTLYGLADGADIDVILPAAGEKMPSPASRALSAKRANVTLSHVKPWPARLFWRSQ